MSKSRAQLRNKALSIIVGGDVGQVPSDEDADTLDGYIDSVVAELSEDGAAYVSDLDSIDEGIFMTLAQLVANAAADEFGGKGDPEKALYYRNRMRVLTRQTPGYGPIASEYF